MYIEGLTEELEDWLEKADEEQNLKFLFRSKKLPQGELIAIELLGYFGSVGQLVTKELQKSSKEIEKLAGIFSNYFDEMIQVNSGEILLPISMLRLKINSQNYLLTTSNFAIPDVISYRLAEELYDTYKELKVSKIILIDGIYSHDRKIEEEPKIHQIISSKYKIEIKNSDKSDFFLIGQIASSFLTYWNKDPGIPIEVYVVESFSDYDPISALKLLKTLKSKFGLIEDFEETKKLSEAFRKDYNEKESIVDNNTMEEEKYDPRYFI
ncbi:MAG: PAC2 family protein [Candidatus Hodarchaeales archaeon]